MNKRQKILTGAAVPLLALLIGCVSSANRTVVTGTTRPPIQAEQVKVYSSPPSSPFEEVATVMAEADGSSQKSVERAMQKLKEAAANLGANGLILQTTKVHKTRMTYYGMPVGPSWGSETGVSAVAIYVR